MDTMSSNYHCCVKVKNRSHSPQRVLDTTGRKQYTDESVVDVMPRGEDDEVEVIFFKLSRYINNTELEKEYELRGLKAVDPFSLVAVNRANPTFADEHPNGTHWQDVNGKWCYVAFSCWHGERYLDVSRKDVDWIDRWWFAGLRK